MHTVKSSTFVRLREAIRPLVVFGDFLLPLSNIGSAAFRRWIVEHVPNKRVQHVRGLIDTLYSHACEIVEMKKTALARGDEAVAQQLGQGKDIMSRLRKCARFVQLPGSSAFPLTVKANMSAAEADRLPDEEVIGQVT